jgi:hypothetical protein
VEWLEWFRKNKVLYFLNLFPCCVQQYPGTSKTCVHVSHVCVTLKIFMFLLYVNLYYFYWVPWGYCML